jgi:adenylate cyclase
MLIEEIPLDSLQPGFSLDEQNFEWLCWKDYNKYLHAIPLPLSSESIASLKAIMKEQSPPRIEDSNGDGAEEEIFVVWHYKDYFVPSITLSLALDYMNVKLDSIEVVLGEYIKIPNPQKYNYESDTWEKYKVIVVNQVTDQEGNEISPARYQEYDEIKIPIDENAQMLINYVGGPSSESYEGVRNFPIRSFASTADRAPSPDQDTWPEDRNAMNQIVMVGAFAKGVAQDEKTTPYGLMYGIEMHANALNTILNARFLRNAPNWLSIVLLVLLTFVTVVLASRIPALFSFIATLGIIIAYFILSMFIFESNSLVLSFATPSISMIFTLLAVVAYKAMTEERDKRQIRETFGKYVSPKVVEQLVDNPPELGGVDKELTVLFSDIRGFTTLSENMSPQELVNHLNVYLTAMTDIILAYNGTLDKYVGDEVMCFWGAPIPMQDHAELACKCALRQMEKLAELNESWPESKRIRIGIGLNSGIMTVGNMGSPTRMNYTLMGDNVNLGARLEGTNKEYGTGIIVSEFTYGLVKDKFIFRELDNIRVKGKNKPVLMYELVDCIGPNIAPLAMKGTPN